MDAESDETFHHIGEWIKTCENTHTACPKPSLTPLPTRVLDVSPPSGPGSVRLHKTSGAEGKYAALSYCWGGPQAVSLTKGTMAQMLQDISLDSLPRTLRDAVFITRKLGIRYLWIDALCIIQDSAEDKEVELEAMARIYRDSAITISAANSASVQDGFLRTINPRPSKYPRFTLPYRAWDDASTVGSVVLQEQFRVDAFSEPINGRGWTLQERLLSPRLLIYGTHELGWQCQTEELTRGGTDKSFDAGSERLEEAFFHPERELSPENFWMSWIDIVIDYTHRKISFAEDKLVALAAVASEFHRLSHSDTYLAGLWHPHSAARTFVDG